jgi:hypothetical protein
MLWRCGKCGHEGQDKDVHPTSTYIVGCPKCGAVAWSPLRDVLPPPDALRTLTVHELIGLLALLPEHTVLQLGPMPADPRNTVSIAVWCQAPPEVVVATGAYVEHIRLRNASR